MCNTVNSSTRDHLHVRVGRTWIEGPLALRMSPRDSSAFDSEFARGLAAEFFAQMKIFGENFDSSAFYDPEGSAHRKRGKTVHGFRVRDYSALSCVK